MRAIFCIYVSQGSLMNLIGGCTPVTGDRSASVSQISLPRIIGNVGVYSAQTAWEVIRDKTEVFVLVTCDQIKNNRIEYTVADHGMSGPWGQTGANACEFILINPQRTALATGWVAQTVSAHPNC
jgi:trimethylamine-N-oxide reductase (cytochrome c)